MKLSLVKLHIDYNNHTQIIVFRGTKVRVHSVCEMTDSTWLRFQSVFNGMRNVIEFDDDRIWVYLFPQRQ